MPAAIHDGLTLRGRLVLLSRARTEPILRNVDLRLPAGAVVALVGENGAGKTTLVKLIGRFYEPTGGAITLDGEDIRRFELADVARAASRPASRTSRGSRCSRARRSASATCRTSTATPVVERALERAHAADVVATLPGGPRDAARPDAGRTAASSPAASGRSSRSAGR